MAVSVAMIPGIRPGVDYYLHAAWAAQPVAAVQPQRGRISQAHRRARSKPPKRERAGCSYSL